MTQRQVILVVRRHLIHGQRPGGDRTQAKQGNQHHRQPSDCGVDPELADCDHREHEADRAPDTDAPVVTQPTFEVTQGGGFHQRQRGTPENVQHQDHREQRAEGVCYQQA